MRFPLMFRRELPANENTGLVPNRQAAEPVRVSYIVVLPLFIDYSFIRTAWQDNPDFPDGRMSIPSIDLLDQKDTYIFDEDDVLENYHAALRKMKELWAQVAVPGVEDMKTQESIDGNQS